VISHTRSQILVKLTDSSKLLWVSLCIREWLKLVRSSSLNRVSSLYLSASLHNVCNWIKAYRKMTNHKQLLDSFWL